MFAPVLMFASSTFVKLFPVASASKVLFVNVFVELAETVMSLVRAIVPVAAGSVTVTSAVAAGPIKVTALVPLSVSSLKSIEPAALEDPVNIGAVKDLLVSVCVPVRVATVESIFKVIVSVALATEAIPVPPAIVTVFPCVTDCAEP